MIQALRNLFRNQNIILALVSFVLGYLIFLADVFNFRNIWWGRLWLISGFAFICVYSVKFYFKKVKQWPDYFRLGSVLFFISIILIIAIFHIPLFFVIYTGDIRFLSYLFVWLYLLGWVFSVVKSLVDHSATIKMKEALHLSVLFNFLLLALLIWMIRQKVELEKKYIEVKKENYEMKRR